MLKQTSYSINFQFCLMINKRSIFLIGTYYMWKRQYNFAYYLHLHPNTYTTFKEHVCIWIRVYVLLLFFVLKCIMHAYIFSLFNVSGRCEDVFVFALWIWSKLQISSTNLCHLSLYMTWIGRKACHKKLSSKEEEKGLC